MLDLIIFGVLALAVVLFVVLLLLKLDGRQRP